MDERPLRLLDRTPVDEEHKERMRGLVRRAQGLAEAAGKELQYEFGKEAVACIVGCNQFLRLYRAGVPGTVELLIPEKKGDIEAAGFATKDAQGAVFRMFGWFGLDPMEGDQAALESAVDAAFERALG